MKYLILQGALLLLSLNVFAQASLEIQIFDENQQPVAFQPVKLINELIGFEESFTTDANGKAFVGGLSTSGDYKVYIPEGSFYKEKFSNSFKLISSKTRSLTIDISSKAVQLEGVAISAADFQSINTINAEVASELHHKELTQLPIEGRDITRSLYRLPNITQSTGFYPEAPNIAINGANPLFTNYQIDELDNNENFLGGQRFAIPVGFTQNITALTNNFSAEHGLTSNGIINITTKSGTNQTNGEVFFVTRPGPVIDSPSPYAQRDLSGNQVKDGFQRYQAGFGIGGPIKKDKTFYFLNVEQTTDLKDNLLNVPQLGINETIRGQNNFTYLSAKVDQHWNNHFRSSLRVNTGIVNIERQGGGLEGGTTFASAGNLQDRNSLNIALKNTYSRQGFTYEGNYLYGRFRWNYANPDNPGSPNVAMEDFSGNSIGQIGHPGFVFDEQESTHLIQQKLTFRKNQHLFKTGLQFKSSGFELQGGGNPNGSYLVQLTDAQINALKENGVSSNLMPEDLPGDVSVLNYNIELRPNAFQKRQDIFSLYIEDQISLSQKTTFNIGLRWDYDNLSKGGGENGDFNNIAPRVSMNHQLNKNTSIRAGYGIYYDKILYAVYSDALQFSNNSSDYKAQLNELIRLGILDANADPDRITNEGNLQAGFSDVEYLNGPEATDLEGQREELFSNEWRILNPNGYQNPYAHQFMIGVQHKVSEQMMFYLDVMHNRSFNLFRLRDLNAPEAYEVNPDNVMVRSQQEADLTRPVPIYNDNGQGFAVIGNDTLTSVARNVMMTETDGRSNYYALNFTFQKARGTDPYAIRLMYTLSYLENNTEDINFRAMDANNFENEWGPSINDRRHLINGIFNVYPTQRWTVTLAALLQSGQPINRIPDGSDYGTTDLNGDGRNFGDAYVGNSDRHPGESRNSDRLPWAYTFDLSTFYTLPIANSQIEIGAYVFNLFNAENLSGYANNATQSNQIQIGASGSRIVRKNAAPPRQYQFSLRYLF
jgi:hypothetical protein